MGPHRLRLGLLVGTLVVGAAADVWVGIRPGLESVPAEVMTRAGGALKAQTIPGTLRVHSPLFGVDELQGLGMLSSRSDLPSEWVRARRRVLVLDRSESPMGGFGSPSERIRLAGSLRLDVHEPSQDAEGNRVPVFDLVQQLLPGTVRVERPRGRIASRCTQERPEGGFACPGQPGWLYAAVETLRIDGADQVCLWAHPTQGGVLVVELPVPSDVAAAHRLELDLASALSDGAVHDTPGGASVRTHVRQRGRVLGQLVRTNRVGWMRGRYALDPGVPVRLEVTSARDGRRHHCLEAVIFETPVASKGSGP